MRAYLILGVIASLFFIVFVLQNTSVVSTHFLFWAFSGSLVITLLLSFALGSIVSLLLAVPLVFKRKKKPEAPVSKINLPENPTRA